MSKPTHKNNRTIRFEQVLNAFVQVVRPYLSLDLQKTRITADDVLYALAYASVQCTSIEAACRDCKALHQAIVCAKFWSQPCQSECSYSVP